jgi:uncharacterized membrane protein
MWYAHDGMGWWMLFGGVFWLFLIVTIGWIAFQLLRRDLGGRADAMDQAKSRYARGEISREEFQQIAQDLTHTTPVVRHDGGPR